MKDKKTGLRIPLGIKPEDVSTTAGQRRYFWGKGCSEIAHHNQGQSLRYSSNHNCVYCHRSALQKNRGNRGSKSKMRQIDAANEDRQLNRELSDIDGWDFK